MNTRAIVGGLLVLCSSGGLVGGLVGCSDKVDNAVEAAKSLSAMGEQAKQMAETANKAAEQAREAAKQQIAPGTDPEAAKQQVEMAGSLAAMAAMRAGEGPIVNWRELAKFVPETIAGFTQHGELEGSTNSVAGMQVTKVERNYKAGDTTAEIEITDAHLVAMLKMPFAMATMINEDSTRGFKKGIRVADHPAIVEWTEKSKLSKLTVLVAGRYIVSITVRKAADSEAAQKLAAALDIAGLAALKPAAEPAAAGNP